MMNKRMLISMMVVGLISALAGAGISAYFSDTETSSGNTFAAGTLDLKVDSQDDPNVQVYFNIGGVLPGQSGCQNIVLANAGSLRGAAYLVFKNIVDNPGVTPEPEPTPDQGELSESLWIRVKVGSDIKKENLLANLANVRIDLGTIEASGSLTVTIEWSIGADVGNEIMGDSVTFDILFGLEQLPYP